MDGDPSTLRLWLTAVLFLAGLVAAIFAGSRLERHRLENRRDKAARRLYDTIRSKIDKAIGAPSDWRMVDGVDGIKDGVRENLGSAFKLVEGIDKKLKAASAVFEDKPDDKKRSGSGADNTAVANQGVMVVVGGTGCAAPEPYGPPLTMAGRKALVRQALQKLEDHWADEQARLAEIKRAQEELLDA
ncbi:MAG: hypothetical protein ACXW3D_01645 [Caulobacteraceae bacterium]